jgi:hypothetical protein
VNWIYLVHDRVQSQDLVNILGGGCGSIKGREFFGELSDYVSEEGLCSWDLLHLGDFVTSTDVSLEVRCIQCW